MRISACVISLGCCKNLVDSEKLMYRLSEKGISLTEDAAEADYVIVNTCGFIEAAQSEAIDTILTAAGERKKDAKLIVTGCLAQRYPHEIFDGMPEIDAVFGIEDEEKIPGYILDQEKDRTLEVSPVAGTYVSGGRIYTTPPHWTYIRIADGCDNFCSYCAIPYIRGRYRSRKKEEILEEVRRLAAGGVREFILVAQDTTRYGKDDPGQGTLAGLLREISLVDGVEWIRFLYAYPEAVTDELLREMTENPKICKYLDIPIQHACDRVLGLMNRKIDRAGMTALIDKVRSLPVPFTLRTTVIAGFPTETEEEHRELLGFLREHPFDRLGAFAYSREENTRAAKMEGQIDEETKQRRLDDIMLQQQEISLERNRLRVGDTELCVAEGTDFETGLVICRSMREVPEVDGVILADANGQSPEFGTLVRVKLTCADIYDMKGEIVYED